LLTVTRSRFRRNLPSRALAIYDGESDGLISTSGPPTVISESYSSRSEDNSERVPWSRIRREESGESGDPGKVSSGGRRPMG
jgi:hypothetical protein